jgi:hypothetical protein
MYEADEPSEMVIVAVCGTDTVGAGKVEEWM